VKLAAARCVAVVIVSALLPTLPQYPRCSAAIGNSLLCDVVPACALASRNYFPEWVEEEVVFGQTIRDFVLLRCRCCCSVV